MVKRGHRQSSVGGVLLRMEEEVRRSIFHVACRGFPMFPLGHRWTDNIRQKSESLSVHGHISRGCLRGLYGTTSIPYLVVTPSPMTYHICRGIARTVG